MYREQLLGGRVGGVLLGDQLLRGLLLLLPLVAELLHALRRLLLLLLAGLHPAPNPPPVQTRDA